MRPLTIVGAGREAWVVLRRGRLRTVYARGADQAVSCGRSTDTLGATVRVAAGMAKRFGEWWRAPPTRRDRVLGAIVGGLGCFWIGALGRLMVGPLPVSLTVVVSWAAGVASAGVVLGVLFPKTTTCICFPFSTFGVNT
jgi:hypothetical protein